MSFPSPSLAPPALTIGQLSYGGLAFGGIVQGAVYNVQKIEGLEPVDVLAGDLQRAQDQGEFAGEDVLPGRDITITQAISAAGVNGSKPTAAQLAALANARMAMAGVLGVKGATEEPLYVQTETGLYACMARPRKHHFPWDSSVFVAGAVVATSMLHSTDPRWYAVPTKTATVGLGEPLGGLSFGGPGSGVSFEGPGSGLSFGGGAEGGRLVVVNNGTFEMRPVLVITGPVTNPRVANLSLPGAPFLSFNVTLNAGEVLTVDLDFQTVTLMSSPGTPAASRRNVLLPGATWWNLPKETASTIGFYSTDTAPAAGTLTVQSADAYNGL